MDYLDITQLVRSVQKSEGHEACFRRPVPEGCQEEDCEWRRYCLQDDIRAKLGEVRQETPFWSPPVTVRETPQEIRVEAEIPGLQASDIKVRIRGNLMNIRGEKNSRKRGEEEDLYLEERTFGPFSKFLRLPERVNTRLADAWAHNGVLHVVVPKDGPVDGKTVRVPVRE